MNCLEWMRIRLIRRATLICKNAHILCNSWGPSIEWQRYYPRMFSLSQNIMPFWWMKTYVVMYTIVQYSHTWYFKELRYKNFEQNQQTRVVHICYNTITIAIPGLNQRVLCHNEWCSIMMAFSEIYALANSGDVLQYTNIATGSIQRSNRHVVARE